MQGGRELEQPAHKPMKTIRRTGVLDKWAYYGSLMRRSKSTKQRDWEPACSMVRALRKRARPEAARLQAALRKSDYALKPLGEPLLVDFGLHRWLKKEREESYSDWLAWIINQLSDAPELVFQLLHIHRADLSLNRGTPLTLSVDRETPVRLVPGESSRRLDLLIKYGTTGLYIIELKVTDPESADDIAKQRIYMDWLQAQHGIQHKKAVLVALEGEEKIYEGFELWPWHYLCVELRRIVGTRLLGEKPIVAALALAFVGAVEENLLGFSGRLASRVYKGDVPPLLTSKISDHLAKFLPEVADER